jgi:hypothetical protein
MLALPPTCSDKEKFEGFDVDQGRTQKLLQGYLTKEMIS